MPALTGGLFCVLALRYNTVHAYSDTAMTNPLSRDDLLAIQAGHKRNADVRAPLVEIRRQHDLMLEGRIDLARMAWLLFLRHGITL